MAEQIPFAKLGIPAALEKQLGPNGPGKTKYALARGVVPLTVDVQLAVLFLLGNEEHPKIKAAALKTLKKMPSKMVAQFVSQKSHPKVLEFIIEFRDQDPVVDERIAMLRSTNERTIMLIARRANAGLCEMLARNHERLLICPDVYVALHANQHCSDLILGSAEAFLRMQQQLPDVPEVRPFRKRAQPAPAPKPKAAPAPVVAQPSPVAPAPVDEATQRQMDLEAEIEAALRGERSPALVKAQEASLKLFDLGEDDTTAGSTASVDEPEDDLGGFAFNFNDETDSFGWDLTADANSADEPEEKERLSMEVKIRNMTVGQRIKLAYLGNKESRTILIRDSNKIVSSAVVKSGRCTDNEVTSIAGNKNLDAEVMRLVAANAEWTRKYPIKVALVSNPKCPVPSALTFLPSLSKKDLQALTRNRGVSSVVNQAAMRLFRKKYNR